MKRFFVFATMLLVFSCKNGDKPAEPSPVADPNAPVDIPFQILKEYPHDTAAFTEGLQYVGGKFYESAGNYGESDIRITDPLTGKVLQSKKLGKNFFGEGITVLNGKAYQLTYMENTAFSYDPKTLKQLDTFKYSFGEGWGMTTNGKNLIVSTGSSNLYFVDPATFKTVKTVGVFDQYGPVGAINELELIKGYIYANLWQQDVIVKVDTATGKVVGKVDLSSLRSRYGYPPLKEVLLTGQKPEVLNGIAYDSAANRIFITGKNWPKLFEVKLDN